MTNDKVSEAQKSINMCVAQSIHDWQTKKKEQLPHLRNWKLMQVFSVCISWTEAEWCKKTIEKLKKKSLLLNSHYVNTERGEHNGWVLGLTTHLNFNPAPLIMSCVMGQINHHFTTLVGTIIPILWGHCKNYTQ